MTSRASVLQQSALAHLDVQRLHGPALPIGGVLSLVCLQIVSCLGLGRDIAIDFEPRYHWLIWECLLGLSPTEGLRDSACYSLMIFLLGFPDPNAHFIASKEMVSVDLLIPPHHVKEIKSIPARQHHRARDFIFGLESIIKQEIFKNQRHFPLDQTHECWAC